MSEAGRIADLQSGAAGTCTLELVEGCRLTLQSSTAFPLASVVKAEIGNRLWMGEVWTCEPGSGCFHIEIRIESYFKDVAGVEELAARFRHERVTRPIADSDEEPAIPPMVNSRRDGS